jgi:hypothetical protein
MPVRVTRSAAKQMTEQDGDEGEATMAAAKVVSRNHKSSSHVGLKSHFDSLSLLFSPAPSLLTFFSLSFFIVHSAGL